MGERYWISGGQIGTILGIIKGKGDVSEIMDVLEGVMNKQFIGSREEFEKRFSEEKIARNINRREIIGLLERLKYNSEIQADLFRKIITRLGEYWNKKEGEKDGVSE